MNKHKRGLARLVSLAIICCFVLVTVMEPVTAAGRSEEGDLVSEPTANSWRYDNGRPIGGAPEISTFAAGPAPWTKNPDGVFVNSRGDEIKGAVKKGIDISHHNGKIDWKTVRDRTDIDFVILRCGYSTDRKAYDDDRFAYNVKECERLGIPYGVYLYSYAESMTEVKGELNHTLRLLKGHRPDYPVYYDLEDKCVLNKGRSNIIKYADYWCSGIEKAGYTAGIYANLNWWNNYLNDSRLDKYEKWVAQWGPRCTYGKDYRLWQCSSTGRVKGIPSDRVDINFEMGDKRIGSVELNSLFTKAGNGYKYQYNGNHINAIPIVRDTRGNRLVKDRDYTVYYSSSRRVDVGGYDITVKGRGAYTGTAKTSMVIVPDAPSKINMRLSVASGGYDDIYGSWSASKGATGYYVYYRRPAKGDAWTLLTATTKTSQLMKNGYDGYRYQYRIVPYHYYKGIRYLSTESIISDSVATLKKPKTPAVEKYSSTQVDVKWNNIYGERGYHISRSSSRTGTNVVFTYRTTSDDHRVITAPGNRTYYYKVRAYQMVTIGDKNYMVYGPWSSPAAYRLR